MKKYLGLVLFILCLTIKLFAQPYITGGNTRHRFAQLNMGMDFRYFGAQGTQSFKINASGIPESFNPGAHTETRFIIGGTHFWGHADFYLAIPIASERASGFFTGVETGAKYFPLRLQDKKVRPYIGMNFLPCSFKQGRGTELIRYKFPMSGGLVYTHKQRQFELGVGYLYDRQSNYFISPSLHVSVQSPSFWISLGYKYQIETTLSAERNWLSGETQKQTEQLEREKKLNGLTLAIGPSVSFFVSRSAHNASVAPYADDHRVSHVFPEFGLGYYLHKPDMQFNLAYRKVVSDISAYDFSQQLLRHSFSLEAYKFLFDYHGFVPFIGPAVSYESLSVTEILGTTTTEHTTAIKPGITFGWDIRPNRLQSVILRTNLRYFPNLRVNMPDKQSVNFDPLEFNFIQVVFMPGRMLQ